ncbi:MAG: SPOR domain-containing protein [Spirochaetaceae bacterium]|jgi:hypothetical protein|nr:SPOR domain-containing protein [Spirochaetaceae bacterium]
MYRERPLKSIIFGVLLFFSALNAYSLGRTDGSYRKSPRLDVTTIDQRTRLIRFDWSKVDYPDEYHFGLYRLDRSTRTNVFIKEIVKTDKQFADTGLQPPLYNYFYVVESVPKGELLQERKDIRSPSDREIAQQTVSAYYIDTRNPQYWIDEDTPSHAERSVPDNTPRPPPGRRTNITQTPNEGIYIGLISFSGKVREITRDPVLIPLDPAGRQELMDKLNVAYTQSNEFGSAPYYAVHSALANLSELQRTGELPRNIEYVTMITFTDGLDTSSTDSSFAPLEGKDFRPGSGNTPEDYKDYLVRELKSRKIGGVNINAYTIGIEGRNKKNNWTFTQLLREMSTDDTHYAKLSDIGQLGSNLSTIADVLNVYTSLVNITFTTPSYPVGTTVRLTFDSNVKDPNKSKYWVEGDVDWVNGKYVLTNLCSNGVHLGDTQNVLGLRTARGIEYTIRLNDDFYTENLKQWQLPPETQNLPANWVLIHDFYSEKSLDIKRDRKSSIVYLVLDCNPALNVEEINSVRGAVQSFIDKLYESTRSGINLKPLGGTGVPQNEIAKNEESPKSIEQSVPETYAPAPQTEDKPTAPAQMQIPEPGIPAVSENATPPAPAKTAPAVVATTPQNNDIPHIVPPATLEEPEPEFNLPAKRPLIENNIHIVNNSPPVSERYTPPVAEPQISVTLIPAETGVVQDTVNIYVPPQSSVYTPPEFSNGEVFLYTQLKAPNYSQPGKGFWIQLGSYHELIRAQRAASPIIAAGFNNLEIFAKEINGSLFFQMKMGPYYSRVEADKALMRLGQSSLRITEGFVVRE